MCLLCIKTENFKTIIFSQAINHESIFNINYIDRLGSFKVVNGLERFSQLNSMIFAKHKIYTIKQVLYNHKMIYSPISILNL